MNFLIIYDEIHDLILNVQTYLKHNGYTVDLFQLKNFQNDTQIKCIFTKYDAIYFDRPEEKSNHFMQQILLLEASNLKNKIINHPISYSIFRNKASGTTWLNSNGFPVPETLVTSNLDEALLFSKNHENVMCKPVYGYCGNGIFGFHSSKVPIESLKERLKNEGILYLQKFITTNPIHDLRVDMVDSEIICSYFRTKETSEKYPRCNISQGAKYKLTVIGNELKLELKKLLQLSNLTVAGVDLIWCSEKNRYLYVEINPEPQQSEWQPEFSTKIAQALIKKAKNIGN